jgi:18S rRNA (guanine1575-N7)-methyltransferase
LVDVAYERESEGDLLEIDMGQGFNFRPGVFDAAISVSALQWLCVASRKSDNPYKRLNTFFSSLFKCLKSGGRAVLQFYPDGTEQVEMITTSALKQGYNLVYAL